MNRFFRKFLVKRTRHRQNRQHKVNCKKQNTVIEDISCVLHVVNIYRVFVHPKLSVERMNVSQQNCT